VEKVDGERVLGFGKGPCFLAPPLLAMGLPLTISNAVLLHSIF